MIAANEKARGEYRMCKRSKMYRPLRSHFCSITQRPVLNMDHFCPWVVNTVGFYNRKFFLLFLFYACGAIGLDIILLFILVPFVWFHFRMAYKNHTTIDG